MEFYYNRKKETEMSDLKKYFFDSHVHLYNLSHVGFLAFVNRLLLNKSISLHDISENRYFTILWRIFSSGNFFCSLLKKILLFVLLILPYVIGFFSPQMIVKSSTIPPDILFFLSLISCIVSGIVFTIIIFIVIKILLTSITEKVINMLSVTENDLGS
ncbi:MAG: hypothetical protein JXJ04_23790, partial [Spirochaetales bacterium]|nr:hypothetical protein [Spirochaetales bacterium]